MENFEISSPINLSTRTMERNVLKELNNLEGATKSAKQLSVSAKDDTAIHLKSPNILSNLPDIVNNVNLDATKAENRNLLNVATTPDIQSEDEYVDCNSTLNSDISGVTVNRTIDNVSKILDETIQILEKHAPTPNDANTTIYIANEKLNEGFINESLTVISNSENKATSHVNNKSGNITQNQSKDTSALIDGTETETTRSTENYEEIHSTEVIDQPVVEKKELNETITSHSDRPLVGNVDQETTSTAIISDINNPTTSPVSATEIAESENDNGPQITLGVEEPNVNEDNLTKVDVEFSSLSQTFSALPTVEDYGQQEATFNVSNNLINSTVLLESSATKSGDDADTSQRINETVILSDNTELDQIKKINEFKANQTISVDSLDLDSETRDCSLDSLEMMKQPINCQLTTPTDKCSSDTTADNLSNKEDSLSGSSHSEKENRVYNMRKSLSRQNAVHVNSPTVCNGKDATFVTNVTGLHNEKSSNGSLSNENTNCSNRVMRRDTFNCTISVNPDDNSSASEEKLPNGDSDNVRKLNESDGNGLLKDTYSLPESSNIGDTCIGEVTSDKVNPSDRLKRRATFNLPVSVSPNDISASEEKLPNSDFKSSDKLNNSNSFVLREDTSSESQNNEDQCTEAMCSEKRNSTLTRGDTFNVTIPVNSNDKSSALMKLPNVELHSTNSTSFVLREDTSLPESQNNEDQCTEAMCSEKRNSTLTRGDTFNVTIPVNSNDKSSALMKLPNVELHSTNSTSFVLREDTSLPESQNNEDQCTEAMCSEKRNSTLTRGDTFNVTFPLNSNDKSSAMLKLPNVELHSANRTSGRQETYSLPVFEIVQSDCKTTESQSLASRSLNDEQQSGGDNTFMVLNSKDFEFLQSRGENCVNTEEEDRRNSLLLRFDPLSQRRSTLEFKPTVQIINEIVKTDEDLNGSGTTESASAEVKATHNQSASQLPNETSSNNILVEVTNTMDNEANGYLNNIRAARNDDKLISVDGVSLSDKKIKFTCTDENIRKKMEEYEANQEKLLKLITEKDKAIAKTSNVLELYEKAIAEALAAKEKLSQSYDKQHEELKTDRDVNFQHLVSLESTFADLHMKFERNVQYTTQLQEKVVSVSDEKEKAEDLLKQQELRYDKMKSHTMQQFDIANTKLEQQTKTISMENTKLKAQIKREEIHKTAVQEELSQKKKENEELVKICDELISGQRS